jgi:hypothetical protein
MTGLAADSCVAGGSNPRPARRIFSMVALFVGALSGAYVLRYGLALPLFVTEACLPVHNRGVCGDRRDSGKRVAGC